MRLFSIPFSLLLAVCLSLTGNGLLGTLSALGLADAEASDGLTGLVLAMYYAGLTGGTWALPETVKRVGHIRSFAAFTALAVFAALAQALTPAGWLWIPLRALTGLCMAGTYLTVESWLNAEARPATRGRVLAAYLVALYLGTAIGQLLVPIWPPAAVESFALVALIAALAVVPVALTRVTTPGLEAVARLTAREVVRGAPLGWGAAILSGFVGATIFASAPLFARASDLTASGVSELMAAFVVGGLLGQWPLGWLSDRVDRRHVLIGTVMTLGALSLTFVLVATEPTRLWWAIAAAFGAMGFAIYPLAVAHTIDRVGPTAALPASAQLLLASSVGAFTAPLVVAAATPWLGPQSFLLLDAFLSIGFGFVAIVRAVRVAAVPQGTFQPMARTTFAAHVLDPRSVEPVPASAKRAASPPRPGPDRAA